MFRKKLKKILLFFLVIVLALFVFDQVHTRIFQKKVDQYIEENPPMISWIDDDGFQSFYTKLYPLAKKHNISLASAFISNRVHNGKTFYTVASGKEMLADGMEIINHGYFHDKNYKPHQMSQRKMEYDYTRSQEINEKHGFNSRIHVYPFGSMKGYSKRLAKKHFDYAFSLKNGLVPRPFDPYSINRVSIQDSTTSSYLPLEDLYQIMDEGAENSSWLVLVSHVDQFCPYEEDYHESFIKYAKQKGYEFVTLEEALDRYKIFERDWYDGIKLEIGHILIKLYQKFIYKIPLEEDINCYIHMDDDYFPQN